MYICKVVGFSSWNAILHELMWTFFGIGSANCEAYAILDGQMFVFFRKMALAVLSRL